MAFWDWQLVGSVRFTAAVCEIQLIALLTVCFVSSSSFIVSLGVELGRDILCFFVSQVLCDYYEVGGNDSIFLIIELKQRNGRLVFIDTRNLIADKHQVVLLLTELLSSLPSLIFQNGCLLGLIQVLVEVERYFPSGGVLYQLIILIDYLDDLAVEVSKEICYRWSENIGLFGEGPPELRPHALDEFAEVVESQLVG